MNPRTYITSAIPYVNAEPHIGFALEIIQADVLARYFRIKSKNDTYFLTGTDENALKNVQAAEKENITTYKLVNKYFKRFKELEKILNLSNDDFIRTTEKRHIQTVEKFWKLCEKDIYKKKYKGMYCVGCEEFKLEKDLRKGKCPEHPTRKLEPVEEENYFFKLSKYQEEIYKLIKSDQLKIVPTKRKNEVLAFIENGLRDFSISRSKERAQGWGIPVPDDPEQIVYVWFDALINYLSGIDYHKNGRLFQKYWNKQTKIIHCIGKGITRFHAIYWPAMLMSAGLPLPKEELVHGYITVAGQKMSKSIGNVISPQELVEKYGTDAVRYYFLKEISPTKDGDFTYKHFQEVYNADLANGLGNLIQRTTTLCEKIELTGIETDYAFYNHKNDIAGLIENYKFNKALIRIREKIAGLDKKIDTQKPWRKKGKELEEILTSLSEEILLISAALSPFLPESSKKITKIFTSEIIKAPSKPLFPRIS
jgi:methionyl-tRNA synthetase